MARGYIGGGGAGAGGGSDDCTATKAQVLADYTAITSDSDDDAEEGTMPDNSTTSSNGTVPGINSSYPAKPTREGSSLQCCTDTDGTVRINLCPPKGYYPGSNGSYINRPAADFGTAVAANVLKSKTFTSGAGLKVSGTMADYTGTPSHITSRRLNNDRFEVAVAKGYHGCSWADDSYEYMEYSEVAGTLGLTAAKLVDGKTVCGVTGTGTWTAKMISAFAARTSSGSEGTDGDEESFTMPADGTVYYGGGSIRSSTSTGIICAIYKNGSVVNSRNMTDNSTENYSYRGTMFDKSFAASKGDVIKVKAQAISSGTNMACIQAVIIYFA